MENGKTPECAAAGLWQSVHRVLSADGLREAAVATNIVQPPENNNRDIGEGSTFNSGEELVFVPQAIGCTACKMTAKLSSEGVVTVPGKCRVSGYCEALLAKVVGEPEIDGLSPERLCRPFEVGCTAVVGSVQDSSEVTAGSCRIERTGPNWRARAFRAWGVAQTAAPDTGIEPFDGQGGERPAEGFSDFDLD